MKLKTAYRPKKSVENIPPVEESAAENIPKIKLSGVEAEPVAALSAEIPPQPEPDLEAIAKAANEAATADEAALALKRQIEALHQSEQLQRQQQAAQTALLSQQPLTREQKLDLWKSQGVPEVEINFLREHPLMVDFPEITRQAAAEAMQVHERDSAPYWETIKMNFDKHLANMQQEQAAAAKPEQQTPAFFRPAAIRKPAAPSPANYVSAPVSREVPSGIPREPNLSQIKLTAEEVEAANFSGISTTEYARQKLRMLKTANERQ